MTVWVALLRAVNVGGTGKLPMAELRTICEDAGFLKVKTYIASGNVVFTSQDDEPHLWTTLETRLHDFTGKPVSVFLRSAADLAQALQANPFADQPGNRVTATFLDRDPPADFADHARHLTDERLAPGPRMIFTYYPNGMGRSKLRLPLAETGTARNMNTLAKLVEMADQASRS